MAERAISKEDQSVWKSRFFKFGVVVAVAAAAFSAWEVAAAGALIAGIAWAGWKGDKK